MEHKDETLFQSLLDFVFPPLCIGCGEYTDQTELICNDCLATIQKVEDIYCLSCHSILHNRQECDICLDDALLLFTYGEYHSALKEMIIQFKFKGIRRPAEIFSKQIAEKFTAPIKRLKADYFVPIPLTSARKSKRGYNQAEIIADNLSEYLEIPTNTEILYRIKDRKPQARIPLKERAENVKSVFDTDEDNTERYNLIVVDDVVTSGSTVQEVVSLLRKAGHQVSGVITLAHAFNL